MTEALYVAVISLLGAWAVHRMLRLTSQRNSARDEVGRLTRALESQRKQRESAHVAVEYAQRQAAQETALRHTIEARLRSHMAICNTTETPISTQPPHARSRR